MPIRSKNIILIGQSIFPTLIISNSTQRRVLLNDGEILKGLGVEEAFPHIHLHAYVHFTIERVGPETVVENRLAVGLRG